MDVSIPPVVRGEFVYRDTLFVDVGGEGKRHTRAYESELKDFLDGKAPKDQVAHWYEAQLIHYGLQRSKEKNTAKVRLQQALSQGKLKVPPHIADMEAQMKKDYASTVRKSKAQSKSSVTKDDGAAGGKATKKRKNDEVEDAASKRTKISMTVGGISINIEQDQQQNSNKKQAASKASKETPAKGGKAVGDTPQRPSSKPTAKSTKGPKDTTGKSDSKTPLRSKTKSTSTAAASSPSKQAAENSKATPAQKADSKVEAGPKAKSETKLKAEPKVKARPKVKAEPKVKKESRVMDEPLDEDDDQDTPRAVTGSYKIFSQQLSDQYEEQADDLRLLLCVDGEEIWGGFQLVGKTGVIKIDGIPEDLQMSFGWRARDDDGSLRFGRGCNGEIELFADSQVRGTIFNMYPEPVHFAGRRKPGPLWCGRSADSFMQEWQGFVAEAYGR